MKKEDFVIWLKDNTDLRVETIQNYSDGISAISNELTKHKIIQGSLYTISDSTSLENLVSEYFSLPEFSEKDSKAKKAYVDALNYYRKFTESTYINIKDNSRENEINLEKYILKDSYIDIAFKRYTTFKESNQYDEFYKIEILSRLNSFLKGLEINELNVLDVVKKLQKENPSAGSFVHWSNAADLVKYAEVRPEEVAELMNRLYHSSPSLEGSIEMFRVKGKAFNPEISLGAPLFGYLLAAKDYKKYPLYKEEVFIKIKNSYGIEKKLGKVEINYSDYFAMCETALLHLKKEHPKLTMLDIQDFFFCSTTYDQIIVEAAVDYLQKMATEIGAFEMNQALMLEEIAMMDEKRLHSLRQQYRNSEKINLIKFLVLDRIIELGSISLEEMEKIKEEVKKKYETNILQAWNNFTILFQLYYSDKKQKVQEEQRKIHESIRRMDEFKKLLFVEGKVLNGFNWNQNFGCSRCWLAVYEASHTNHRTAPQFFVAIDKKGIEYGLTYGDQHKLGGKLNVTVEVDREAFNYQSFREKMTGVLEEFTSEKPAGSIGDPPESYALPKEISAVTWLELLQNKEVFWEADLVYLYKMYELGGEATATQLAEALGTHVSAFNIPLENLAKRIHQATEFEPFVEEDGQHSYYNILLEGEVLKTNHFLWRLKPNLNEAIAEVLNHPKPSQYNKEDFLSEVFMEEKEYDSISNLLKYKKNIILQGPPGVGKTFVSKRLAYSLMGEKDETRVEMVQFHQNYAYEDFVMGFRPKIEGDGFSLQSGIFFDFCNRALKNPEKDYFFVIDEINRGNLSKIFGELFMLIEKDKRDEFVTMGYSKDKFTVPSNVYLIGTMNTADRSLAQLDVALRRRFAFVALAPTFNKKWEEHILAAGVSAELTTRIFNTVKKLNKEIVEDFQLGSGYAIGHSFFSSKPENMDEKNWFDGIIAFEIVPLLEEYYFDRPEIVEQLVEEL